MPHRTLLCRLIVCALFSVTFINVFGTSSPSFRFPYWTPPAEALVKDTVFCPQSDLADDVLVVLRTGATESHQKVPVHLRTTLRCVPHFVVLSDLDEQIEGHHVYDVLGGVSEATRTHHADFKLYHQLQKHGKAGVENQNVVTALSGSSKGDYLNTENAGWQLDKWKFLPAVERAFRYRPQAKWFVFVETDTYFVWNNLLEYLSHFDPTKELYMGKHLYIKNVEFAYGGAGFVLSNPAMRKVIEHRSVRIKEYEDFTANNWVGDCSLGKVLGDVKIPLFKAFPHMQGDSPATLNPNTTKLNRDLWCYPAITYHHVSPAEIEELWQTEQSWFQRHEILLRHRDIFMELVKPKIRSAVHGWDNMSTDKKYTEKDSSHLYNALERDSWRSFEQCRALCESQRKCMQFSYQEKECALSESFRLGYAKPEEKMTAGWMMERVDDLFLDLENGCGVRDWFVPENKTMKRVKR